MEKPLSKFADNLEDLAERTAEYIRMLEKDVERLNKIKVNLSQRSLENTKEIAELQELLKKSLTFAEFTLDRAQNFCDEYLENKAMEFIETIKRN